MTAAYLNAGNNRAIADLAAQNIDGQNAANHALFHVGAGVVDPNHLHDALQAILVAGGAERLRAFMRTLQKRLEREA